MNLKTYFSPSAKEAIRETIEKAEKNCRGEIRVHLEKKCREDALKRAIRLFGKLGMHKTRDRSGVLIYLAVEDKKAAIVGDRGIYEKVPPDFWDNSLNLLTDSLRISKGDDGLIEVIRKAGEQLSRYFPYNDSDRNELSNDISYGE